MSKLDEAVEAGWVVTPENSGKLEELYTNYDRAKHAQAQMSRAQNGAAKVLGELAAAGFFCAECHNW